MLRSSVFLSSTGNDRQQFAHCVQSIRVKYFWLNALTMPSMLSGAFCLSQERNSQFSSSCSCESCWILDRSVSAKTLKLDRVRARTRSAGKGTVKFNSDASVSEAQQPELLLLLRAMIDSLSGVRLAFSELSRCSDPGKAGQDHERQPPGVTKGIISQMARCWIAALLCGASTKLCER